MFIGIFHISVFSSLVTFVTLVWFVNPSSVFHLSVSLCAALGHAFLMAAGMLWLAGAVLFISYWQLFFCSLTCMIYHQLLTYSLKVIFFKFMDLREREKHWFVVPLIFAFIGWFLVCALTGDQTCSLGLSGPYSNQLSCLARAYKSDFKGFIYYPIHHIQ